MLCGCEEEEENTLWGVSNKTHEVLNTAVKWHHTAAAQAMQALMCGAVAVAL